MLYVISYNSKVITNYLEPPSSNMLYGVPTFPAAMCWREGRFRMEGHESPKIDFLELQNWRTPWLFGLNIWAFPKMVGKIPPNHPFVHRVFHYFHHPFWGFSPYFWKHPIYWTSFFCLGVIIQEFILGIPFLTTSRMGCETIQSVYFFRCWFLKEDPAVRQIPIQRRNCDCMDSFHPSGGYLWWPWWLTSLRVR